MSGEPSISVVVNTCDRCAQLRTLLYALHRQTYPEFEVVVALGPTHDDTEEMIAEEFPGRVQLVRCGEFNLSVSRNLGLAHAAGEVVAFIDDDAVPASRWLEQLAEAYAASPEAAGVGGRTYLIHPDRMGEVQFLSGRVSVLAEQDDVRWDDAVPPASATPGTFWFPRFHGTNMSYRRRALVAVGGFDERFEYLFDDADIAVRLGLAGYRLEPLRQGVVFHVPASGRHRGEKSPYDLNWYCWLRSTVYFALKNGVPTVGRRRSLGKAAGHVSHFYTVIGDLARAGKLPPELYRKARAMLRKAWLEGFAVGLFGRRRIPGTVGRVERPLLPFPRRDGPPLPAIAPTGLGRREKVKPLDDEPLCICLVSAGYPPRSTEGVARSTHTLARGLAELGHEVHVVTTGDEHRVAFRDGAYVHEIRPRPISRYAALGAAGCHGLQARLDASHAAYDEVRAACRNHGLRIVEAALPSLDGLVTAVAGTVPVAVRSTAASLPAGRGVEQRLLRELGRELLRRACAVITSSEAAAAALAESYGFDTASTAHDGVVPPGIVPVDEAEIGEPASGDGEATILVVASEGAADLLAALLEVLKEHPRTRLVVAGAAEETARLAAERAPRQVEVIAAADAAELRRRVRACDLVVADSRSASPDFVDLEAMNYARPIIRCPGDGARLAEAIGSLVADAGRRREIGRAGRERLLERFTHVRMAESWVGVCRRALG